MISRDDEWIAVPDEGDLLECRTMARIAWTVEGQRMTRVYDRATQSQRDGIYIPVYELAGWLVDNWWSLLYEPWPFAGPVPGPGGAVAPDVMGWMHRHCMRTALSGYAAPNVCIFSHGRDVGIVSRADPRGLYVHAPVDYTETFEVQGNREELRVELAQFIQWVLARMEGFADVRVAELHGSWSAICATTAEEAEFCRAAGRLGLDPYDVSEWPEGVVEWFERAPPGWLDSGLVEDLLECPDPAGVKLGQHVALTRIVEELGLSAAANDFGAATREATAFAEGYSLASWVRTGMSLNGGERLTDVRAAAEAACGRAMVVQESVLPEGRILAVAGWKSNPGPVVATRSSGVLTTIRFLACRGLYMALRGATRGPRLVTDARTWVQRASRAFAAELLAPRTSALERYAEAERRVGCDEAEVQVARHYDVSPKVIRHQIENAGGGSERI